MGDFDLQDELETRRQVVSPLLEAGVAEASANCGAACIGPHKVACRLHLYGEFLPCRIRRDFDPKEELERRRQALVPILEAGVAEASAARPEARLAAGVLAAVAGRPHALRVLLGSHSARLKRAQQQLLKPQNSGTAIAELTRQMTHVCCACCWAAT